VAAFLHAEHDLVIITILLLFCFFASQPLFLWLLRVFTAHSSRRNIIQKGAHNNNYTNSSRQPPSVHTLCPFAGQKRTV